MCNHRFGCLVIREWYYLTMRCGLGSAHEALLEGVCCCKCNSGFQMLKPGPVCVSLFLLPVDQDVEALSYLSSTLPAFEQPCSSS